MLILRDYLRASDSASFGASRIELQAKNANDLALSVAILTNTVSAANDDF